ncbi:MAG: DNA polymerase V [Parcubacteria group bacterium Licking1014_17]|nr:MAG: DNA polymerase V [Parcubacteria group bacterium Licking1014_17]
MPSYSEIMKLTGFKSKNAIYRLVNKMIEADLVEKDSAGRLIPNKLSGMVRILGTVEAGIPLSAEQEKAETINIDEYLIRNYESSFILKVKGDSMVEAGILPGDMVLVERGKLPHNGDIVVAEVDHEWTMKFFKKKDGKVLLVPGNKKYKPIVPRHELNIAAVVRAVIRKY